MIEYEWKLEDESKIIGKYLCFKATATLEVESMMVLGDDDKEEPSEELKVETKTIVK